MSGYGVHANFEAIEATTDGLDQTLPFNRRSRKIVVTNDHASNNLQFKFAASESYGILKGTESLSIYLRSKQIIIKGTDVPYRIWVFG